MTDEIELARIRQEQTQRFNDLAIAGVNDIIALTAVSTATVERVVAAKGNAGAVAWLRAQADLLEAHPMGD